MIIITYINDAQITV